MARFDPRGVTFAGRDIISWSLIHEIVRTTVKPIRGHEFLTALLAALPKWLSAAGFTSAVLSVYTDNQAAIASYVHAGWVPTGDATPHRGSGRLEQQYRLGSGAPQ